MKNLNLNTIIRVLIPSKEPAACLYSDVKIRVDKKLRCAIFNTTELTKLSNAEGEIALDVGSLYSLLEKVDVLHTYVKTPTSDKRWEDDPVWSINPPKISTPNDPLGQRATISFMGKEIGSLDEDGTIKMWDA